MVYSDEGEVSIEEEKNHKKTGLRWKPKPAKKFKFVDDGIIASKINMYSGNLTVDAEGRRFKEKHDLITQNMFRRVVARAEGRGMVVNNAKTRVLCISDANTYKASCFLLASDGEKISSGGGMKILGFHVDGRPTCHAHVAALQSRMRESTWVLRHLKHNGFNEDELAAVYGTVILPVLDYCCVVYHPLLTDEQDQQVERLQAQALKNIYGFKMKYADMRDKAGVTTHRARRVMLCDKFAKKAAGDPRYGYRWFPVREGRTCGRRQADFYKEFTARTNRLFNSPLFYYRRRLNGKNGKEYGERNRKYRD